MSYSAEPRRDRELGTLLRGAGRAEEPTDAQLSALGERIRGAATPLLQQRELGPARFGTTRSTGRARSSQLGRQRRSRQVCACSGCRADGPRASRRYRPSGSRCWEPPPTISRRTICWTCSPQTRRLRKIAGGDDEWPSCWIAVQPDARARRARRSRACERCHGGDDRTGRHPAAGVWNAGRHGLSPPVIDSPVPHRGGSSPVSSRIVARTRTLGRQDSAIDSVMTTRAGEFNALREEIRPRVDLLVTTVRADIEKTLTPGSVRNSARCSSVLATSSSPRAKLPTRTSPPHSHALSSFQFFARCWLAARPSWSRASPRRRRPSRFQRPRSHGATSPSACRPRASSSRSTRSTSSRKPTARSSRCRWTSAPSSRKANCSRRSIPAT